MPRDDRRLSRAAVTGAALVLAVWAALAVAVHRRNGVWETKRALWADAIEKARCGPRAHLSLGFAYREQRRYPEAIEEYRKGLACPGTSPAIELMLLRNLGAALIWSDRHDEAIQVLGEAEARDATDSDILTNLAVAWLGKGDVSRADSYARRAIAAANDPGYALNVLGMVQMRQGDLASARASFERAVAHDPDVGVRSFNLGKVLDAQGDARAACAAWQRAMRARLDDGTRRQVARALATRCSVAPTR